MFARTIHGGLIALLLSACTLPDGPQPIAWDGDACTHCRMHLGDPRFAVQVQTRDGRVLNFDDPGCAFEYRAEHKLDIHAVWYHHSREDRWIPESRVAFVSGEKTPMGFGYAAVDNDVPSASSLAETMKALPGARGESP